MCIFLISLVIGTIYIVIGIYLTLLFDNMFYRFPFELLVLFWPIAFIIYIIFKLKEIYKQRRKIKMIKNEQGTLDYHLYDIEVRELGFTTRIYIIFMILFKQPVRLRLDEEGISFKANGVKCDGIIL